MVSLVKNMNVMLLEALIFVHSAFFLFLQVLNVQTKLKSSTSNRLFTPKVTFLPRKSILIYKVLSAMLSAENNGCDGDKFAEINNM